MKKILVVEDEYYARKSIVKILQESDLDIQVCGEAANGMKAIELLDIGYNRYTNAKNGRIGTGLIFT